MAPTTFVARDFRYCSILNNATFDGSVYIYALGGSISSVNPDSNWFYNFIDYRAAQVEKAIVSQRQLKLVILGLFYENKNYKADFCYLNF